MRYYMGYRVDTGEREVFRVAYEPSVVSHGGVYAAVVGPFRTKRGAVFMAKHGQNNPHVQTVADAERWGRHWAEAERHIATDEWNYRLALALGG